MNNLLLRRAGWVVILLCAIAIVGFWITLKRRPPEPPPVVMLTRPYSTPLHLRDWIGQWIPRRSGWLWAIKAEDFVFGRRTVVTLSTQIMWITNSATFENPDFKLRPPDYSNSNGLRAWFMPARELKSLRENFRQNGTETINQMRVTTADGIPATLFSGESVLVNGATNQVGLEAAYFASANKQRTDLFASIQLTETKTNAAIAAQGALGTISLQTNLDVAVRLQIPKGSGVFMVNTAPLEPNGKHIGVIIDLP